MVVTCRAVLPLVCWTEPTGSGAMQFREDANNGGEWRIRREIRVDKAIVGKSTDESTN